MGVFPPNNVHCTNVTKNNESRVQLLAWINKTLQSNFKRFEELCNGAAYCQLLEMLYPGHIDLDKVHLSTNLEHENIHNLKLLQRAFQTLYIRRDIPIDELAKGRRKESLEFLQWFKKFFDANNDGSAYDPVAARGGRPIGYGKSSLRASCSSGDGIRSKPSTPRSAMCTPRMQQSRAVSSVSLSAGMQTATTKLIRQSSGMESVSNSPDNASLGRGGRPNNIRPSSLPRPCGSGLGLLSNSPTPTSPMYTPKTQLSRASSSLLQSAGMRTGSTYGLVRQNSGMESVSIKSVDQSSMSPCVQPTDKFTGILKPTDNVPAANMPPNLSKMDIDFFKSIGISILPGMTEDELSKLFEAKCTLMAHEFRVDRYKLTLAKEIATEFEEGVDGNIAKQILDVIQETEKRFEDPSCDN